MNSELERLNAFMDKHNQASLKAVDVAKQAFDSIIAGLGDDAMIEHRATVLGQLMHSLGALEPDQDCEQLLLRWAAERYWGMKVAAHLSIFDVCYQRLLVLKATESNPFIWGDIDCGAWIEPAVKDRKVIALTVYCSAADDDTWLYIYSSDSISVRFHVRTIWPKGTRSKPTITVYRKAGFEFDYRHKTGYGDCRDIGYQLSYEQMFLGPPKVDHADSFSDGVYWALWNLRGIHSAVESISSPNEGTLNE